MMIETEPSGLLMVRFKLYFNQQHPDPEDPWVFDYFKAHGLEPRRELREEHEGVPYTVLHFGQCYLGRHVESLSNLYKRGVEHTVLAQYLDGLLQEATDPMLRAAAAQLDASALRELTTTLAAQLYDIARFEVTEDKNLQVSIDYTAVREALTQIVVRGS